MKHLFLINPAAGKKGSTEALEHSIRAIFAPRGEPWEAILTRGLGHAETLSLIHI